MTEDKAAPANGSILVVGGGISGLTTALEAAEVGYEVFLVEKNPYLGGRVAQLNQYFPKLCPPSCGLEINFKRIKNNRKIRMYNTTEVKSVSGSAGNYQVTLETKPRFVNNNCTGCNACVDVCPEVFEMVGDLAVAKQDEVPSGTEESLMQAVEDCPVEAIRVDG